MSQLSIAYKVVNSYKKKLDNKMKQGLTSARSVRLAIKPAVALMLLTDQGGELLPDLKSVKEYLVAFPGQAAALHGFINFLNDEYNTNIDYVTIKKSNSIKKANKNKLENDLIKMICSNQRIDMLTWVKTGLQFFHDMSNQQALRVKSEMVEEVQDGYNISYNNKKYWLPKNTHCLFQKND